MIKSIRGKNFQSLEDIELELHPGVNVITGIGDSGKSAVKRLVEWIKNNRPIGSRYMSDFAGDEATVGEVEFGDVGVTFTKDKKAAIYEVTGYEDPFRKMKTGVPDAVTDAFRMSDINFQGQFDKPFLLTMTKGMLAKLFNRVAKLDDVAIWLAELAERRAEYNAKLTQAIDSHDKAKATVDRYARFGELADIISNAKACEAEHSALKAEADSARLAYGRVRNRLDSLAKLEGLDDAVELAAQASEYDKLNGNLIRVMEMLLGVKDKRSTVDKLNGAIASLAAIIENAGKHERQRKKLYEKATDINAIIDKLTQLHKYNNGLRIDKKRYEKALRDKSKCPICSGLLTDNVIEKEVARYE